MRSCHAADACPIWCSRKRKASAGAPRRNTSDDRQRWLQHDRGAGGDGERDERVAQLAHPELADGHGRVDPFELESELLADAEQSTEPISGAVEQRNDYLAERGHRQRTRRLRPTAAGAGEVRPDTLSQGDVAEAPELAEQQRRAEPAEQRGDSDQSAHLSTRCSSGRRMMRADHSQHTTIMARATTTTTWPAGVS